jgi:hypothetical protein
MGELHAGIGLAGSDNAPDDTHKIARGNVTPFAAMRRNFIARH